MRVRQNGFTLVEVLVAIAVLGLAVLALVRLGAANATTLVRAETAMLADIVAENAVVEALTQPLPPSLGEARQTVVNAGQTWTVVTRVAEAGERGLLRIDVSVEDAGSSVSSLTAFRSEQ
jgi:general secretion pathway protein I